MNYIISIRGISDIIHHSALSLIPDLPANKEKSAITKKRAGTRTESDEVRLRELETLVSLWVNKEGVPEIPPAAMRGCLEAAARKSKQGPLVHEGLLVSDCMEFNYDRSKYGETLGELSKTTQFTVPVVVQKARILRTRAKFDCPWSAKFRVETFGGAVGANHLGEWAEIGGRAIGLGDWRPQRSGSFGRFELVSVSQEK